MREEISALAHTAKRLTWFAVDYRRMATEFPRHRERYLAESRRLRQLAVWSLARARRMREQLQ